MAISLMSPICSGTYYLVIALCAFLGYPSLSRSDFENSGFVTHSSLEYTCQ
jgi:hypothetical protein